VFPPYIYSNLFFSFFIYMYVFFWVVFFVDFVAADGYRPPYLLRSVVASDLRLLVVSGESTISGCCVRPISFLPDSDSYVLDPSVRCTRIMIAQTGTVRQFVLCYGVCCQAGFSTSPPTFYRTTVKIPSKQMRNWLSVLTHCLLPLPYLSAPKRIGIQCGRWASACLVVFPPHMCFAMCDLVPVLERGFPIVVKNGASISDFLGLTLGEM
jgi:hypothetical protein